MRYVRFLKTPRVVTEKGTSKRQISCLITITSDLGDSFLPHDVKLSAKLLSSAPSEEILMWQTVQWSAGMRSLPVNFPLTKSHTTSKLRIRVGVEPKSSPDDYSSLSDEGGCGVVSAWSSDFAASGSAAAAEKLVERRFSLANDSTVSILEETGESIARHLWDAGITLSCQIIDLLDEKSELSRALLKSPRVTQLRVLELGTGCGMLGIAIATVIDGADVLLTDLPEAQEIVESNTDRAVVGDSSLRFQMLDWDIELPANLQSPPSQYDLIVAADCTYNPDSSPALVNTLVRLAKISPEARIAIAMKMRHSSEEVFFELMATAGFQETVKLHYPLPGDVEVGEEVVNLHVYQNRP